MWKCGQRLELRVFLSSLFNTVTPPIRSAKFIFLLSNTPPLCSNAKISLLLQFPGCCLFSSRLLGPCIDTFWATRAVYVPSLRIACSPRTPCFQRGLRAACLWPRNPSCWSGRGCLAPGNSSSAALTNHIPSPGDLSSDGGMHFKRMVISSLWVLF